MRIRVTETKGTQAQRQAIYSACGELAIRRARKLGLPVTFVRGTDIVKEFADGTEAVIGHTEPDVKVVKRIIKLK